MVDQNGRSEPESAREGVVADSKSFSGDDFLSPSWPSTLQSSLNPVSSVHEGESSHLFIASLTLSMMTHPAKGLVNAELHCLRYCLRIDELV